MRLRPILTAIGGALCLAAAADVADEARGLLAKGDADSACELLRAELDKNPDGGNAGTLNSLLGDAELMNGNRAAAREAYNRATKRGVADAYRGLGRIGMQEYDFNRAAADFAKYTELKNNAKKPADPAVEQERQTALNAAQHLSRVDDVVILDSIDMPRTDFLKAYKLPRSSGRISPAGITEENTAKRLHTCFINEQKDFMLIGVNDSTAVTRPLEYIRLNTGEWQPVEVDSTLYIGNFDYPFMMPDGQTLYFASDGDLSIGGLDIFMATRDPEDDSYMPPVNLGMPYNSPFDDFMMAIDEEHNVGWFASDRNSPGGDVTVYMFIPNEIRRNLDPDSVDVAARARIADFKATWPEGADYTELLEKVAAIDPDAVPKESIFFPLGDGTAVTDPDDFNHSAREFYQQYIAAESELADVTGKLREMRTRYHDRPSERLRDEILGAEAAQERYREQMRKLRAQAVKAQLHGK